MPKSAYCDFGDIECWAHIGSGDILPDMDDPENKVKSLPKQEKQAAVARIGRDKWKQMSWNARYSELSQGGGTTKGICGTCRLTVFSTQERIQKGNVYYHKECEKV